MAFRGALLKPSEKNSGRVKPSRSISKQSRYEVLKEKIRNWWEDRLKIGEALREIRESKLYKDEYQSFEEFCDHEYGLKHSQAYRLIEAAGIKDSIKSSPMGDKISNERQARALAPVPADQRAEVIERAAEQGPITAKTITEAAEQIVKSEPAKIPKEKTEKHLDKTGYPIPDSILADWQRAEGFRPTLNELQKIKLYVEKSLDRSELIFREIGKDTLIELQNAWNNLKSVLPYAVCPTCQGRNRDNCTVCKGRGWVSEFGYKNWFPKKTIELRERAIKK
jgi:hypothetical protein